MLLREAREYAATSSKFAGLSREGKVIAAALWLLSLDSGHDEEAGDAVDGPGWSALFYRPNRPTSFILWVAPSGFVDFSEYPSKKVLAIWEEVQRDLEEGYGDEDADEDADEGADE
jgi:hypothetical protein